MPVKTIPSMAFIAPLIPVSLISSHLALFPRYRCNLYIWGLFAAVQVYQNRPTPSAWGENEAHFW